MIMSNKRNFSLDILRIICMCMIITLHFFSYSNVNDFIPRYSILFWVKLLICSVSGVCVNCFILISGYFASKSIFKLSKLFSLVREVFTYSFVIYLIFLSSGVIEFKIKEFFFSFLPSLTRQYWFITTYLGLYILSPFVKAAVERLKKREFLSLLVVGFLLFVVYYNLFFFCDNLNFGGSTGIIWFIYLYLCGMYVNEYMNKNSLSQNLRRYFFILALNIGSRVPFFILNIITDKEIFYTGSSIFGSVYNSIFVFLQSILFFKIFVDYSVKLSKNIERIISFLSFTSLATYLIHDNNLIRELLWSHLNFSYINSAVELVVTWLVVVFVIYCISSFIEIFRQKIDNKIWKKEKLQKLDSFFENKANSFLNKIERI